MDEGRQALELQGFIDEFRPALQVPDSVPTDELAGWLDEYGQLCEEVNQRLRECFVLVQRGQYSNAVALSEQEPNLLNRCAVLEIPERDVLSDVALRAGVKPPPLLNRALVEALQEAYQKGNTASGNLALLHKLTLARAPLPVRLTVMRRMFQQNPNHPFLDLDIRSFEKAWFKQVVDFAAASVKRGRAELLPEIFRDFEESGYLETPPSAVIAVLKGQLARAHAAQLPSLAAEIWNQHQRQSAAELAPLVEKWQAMTADLDPGQEAQHPGISDAIAWLAQVQALEATAEQTKKAHARLARLVQDPQTERPDLEAAYRKAGGLAPVDAAVEQSYRNRLRRFGRRRAVRWAGIACGLLMLVCLASIGVVAAVRRMERADEIKRFVNELAALVDGGQYDEAVAKGYAVQASIGSDEHARSLLTKAQERIAARRSLAKALADFDEEPATADVESLVEAARRHARTDDDQRQIASAAAQTKKRRAAARNEEAAQFARQVAELGESATQLLAAARRGLNDSAQQAAVQKVRDRLASLRAQASRLKADDHDLKEVEGRLEAVDGWRAAGATLTQLRKELDGASANDSVLERIAACLSGKFAQACPDKQLAARAQLASPSLAVWKNALELHHALQSGGTPKEPPKDRWKDRPPAQALEAANRYAQMLRQRDAALDGTAAADMKAYLGHREIKAIWRIRRAGDADICYYSTKKPYTKEGQQRVDALMDPAGTIVEGIPLPGNWDVEPAPQSLFALHAAELWKPGEKTAWHADLGKQVASLIAADTMEPLVKVRLVRKLLQLAENTSEGYRHALESNRGYQAISTARASQLEGNWLNPGKDAGVQKSREKAIALLAATPNLNSLAAGAAKYDDNLLQEIKRSLLVPGWLSRDAAGVPLLARFSGQQAAAGSHLYTVVAGEWIEVGLSTDTGEQLTELADQYIGWPVFSVRTFK